MGLIQVTPPYDRLYTTQKFITLMTGGRGGAKSFQGATFIKRLTYEAGHRMLYSRYTMTSAEKSVIPEFTDKIEREGDGKFFHVTKNSILNKRSGSGILFSGIKTSSGNQTANLKSIQGLTTFIGDEMEEWQSEEEFDALRYSIRTKGVQNRILMIMNPSNVEHWIYTKYIEPYLVEVEVDGVMVQMSTHPDVEHIHTTYLDNLQHLDAKFLQEVRHDKIARPDYYAHKIIGRWAAAREGLVFTKVVRGEFPENVPFCWGVDWGFVDPFTLSKIYIDRENYRIYVDNVCYQSGLEPNEFYQVITTHVGEDELVIWDSARPELGIPLATQFDLNAMPCIDKAQKATTLIALQDYTIVDCSEELHFFKDTKKYAWKEERAEIPEDGNDHVSDPICYVYKWMVRSVFE